MKPRSRLWIWIGLGAAAALALVIYLLVWQHEPLEKYGVSYSIDFGEHEEYQHMWFHWDRGDRKIKGPCVVGEDLYVEYKYYDDSKYPDIVVRNGLDRFSHATLRLNFDDPSKPDIELLENQGMGVRYTPPWDDYYPNQQPRQGK